MNPCQAVGRIIADSLVDRTFEDGLYRPARPVVHAVSELEISQRKFRIVNVILQRTKFGLVELTMLNYFRVEPLKG